MEDSRAPLLPPIRRARGYRLYDHQGRRYLDLFRDGGGALLGHRTGTAGSLMKSALSQGLAVAVPSVWEARLAKMLASMFPSNGTVRLYASRARALEAASRFLGMRVDAADLYDPALDAACAPGVRAALWRPLLPGAAASGAEAPPWDVLLPVLPLTISGAPAPLCLPGGPHASLPDADRLPGFILAGAARGLADLRAVSRLPSFADARIEKAVDGAAGWTRRGPYVRAAFEPAEYPRVFAAFLREGVLLSPGYPGPSILPGECSPGETRLLAELFARIPGG